MRKKASFSDAFLIAAVFTCAMIVSVMLWTMTLRQYTRATPVVLYTAHNAVTGEKKDETNDLRYSYDTFETSYSRVVRQNNTYYSLKSESADQENIESAAKPVAARAEEIPVNYTELVYPSVPYPVYAFVGEDGKMNYRVMLEKSSGGKKTRGFVSATQVIRNRKIGVEYDEDGIFILENEENFGEIIAKEPDEEQVRGLQKVYGKTGVYQNLQSNEFYVFGHYPDGEDSFFLADKNGNMIKGTLPLGDSIVGTKEEGTP